MRIIVVCLEQLLSSAKLMHDPITLMSSLHNVLVSLMLERPIVLCLTSDHNTYSHESTSNRKDKSIWQHNHFLPYLSGNSTSKYYEIDFVQMSPFLLSVMINCSRLESGKNSEVTTSSRLY